MGPYVYVNFALVGVFAFAAVHYGTIWLLSRRETVLLMFAAHCALAAALSASMAAMATTTTLRAAQMALNARTTFALLSVATTAWVVSRVTGVAARRFVIPVMVFLVGAAAVQTFVFPLAGVVTGLMRISTPWGEAVTILERGAPRWWIVVPVYAAGLAVAVFGLVAASRLSARDRTGGFLIALASGTLFLGALAGALIDMAHLPWPYIGNLPQVVWVALIALMLSREYVRRGEHLAASERRVRAIFDQTFQFIGLMEVDGTLIEVNRTALAFAGIPEEEVLGKPFWDTPWWRHSPELQVRLRAAVSEAAAGSTVRFEATHLRPDGGLAYVDFSLKPVRNESGAITLLIPEGRDITNRKLSEQAITMSEARYRTMIDSAPEAIVVLDMEHGVFVDFNQKACELFDASAERLRGLGPAELSPPRQPDGRDSAEAAREYIGQALEGGTPIFEWTHRTLSGRDILCEVRLVKLPDPSRLLVRGSVTDISERKRAEHALREVWSRHRAILESSLDGLIVIDAFGRVLEFNPAAETIFGYRREDSVGRFLTELIVPPALREDHIRGLEQYRETRHGAILGKRIEMPALRADGTEVRVELAIQPIAGIEPPLFAGAVRDITERLQLEEQLRQSQKMDAIGQLAGGVAHDFNNLLTVISGYCELLMTSLPPRNPLREYVTGISDASDRAASLTKRLLAFSRRSMLEPEILDLNIVVDDTQNMLRRLIGEGIQLTVVLDPGVRRVKADKTHVGQVLMNLAVNARDAMPNGGSLTIKTDNITLDDSPGHDNTPGNYVRVTVSDTGCGMSPDLKARIFEPFFTTKGVGKGTGLGLSVVHGIVQQSGGHIEVESKPGAGTTFRVYLPAIDEPAAESIPGQGDEELPQARGQTILLVEDEDSVRRIFALALEADGFIVLSTGGGLEALRLTEKRDAIDLMVTDLVMPDINGRDLAGMMRSRFPGLRVLFVSGYAAEGMLPNDLLQTDGAFLKKPFSLNALTRKVRELLASARNPESSM